MRNHRGFSPIAVFLGVLGVLSGDAALLLGESAGAAAEERLVVRIYDAVGLAFAETTIARDAAGAILKDAGLQLVWRDCLADCADAPGPRELLVRIVAAPKAAASGSLGYAVVDIEQGTGALATVYADRIKSVARRTGSDPGRLIGRAIAHEIGHLLLGTAHHSAAGLMRARWSDLEVQRDLEPDWALSPQEIAKLSRGLFAFGEARRRVTF